MDILEKAEQTLVDAQAKVKNAEQAVQLQREENDARMEAVNRKLEIARIKADDLRNGSGKLSRRKLKLAIEQAERKLAIAVLEQQDYDELVNSGHVSQREYDKVADARKQRGEQLNLARAELDNFDSFELPRLLREAELLVDEANSEAARVVRTITLELKQRENDLGKRKHDLKVAREQWVRARQNVANCDIRAPIGGTLLYLELPHQGQSQKPQLGDAIWYRQAFMAIPDTRDLVVEMQVREIDLARLQVGAPADISLDAFPGKTYPGELLSVGSVAEQGRAVDSIQRFGGQVRFAEAPDGVHIGMSADVRIVIRELVDVLAVPLQAVSYRDNQPGVFVRSGKRSEWRTIEPGAMGTRWVEVRDGLQRGEQVEVGRR